LGRSARCELTLAPMPMGSRREITEGRANDVFDPSKETHDQPL